MGKKTHKQFYKMREQGVDSTIFYDVAESEYEPVDPHPEDVIWDDDNLFDDKPTYEASPIKRNRYDDFKNVGDRHY